MMAANQKNQTDNETERSVLVDIAAAAITTVAVHAAIPSHVVVVGIARGARHVDRLGRVVVIGKGIPIGIGDCRIFQIAVARHVKHGSIPSVYQVNASGIRTVKFERAEAMPCKRNNDNFAGGIIELIAAAVEFGLRYRDFLVLRNFFPAKNIFLTIGVYYLEARARNQ